MSYLFDSSNMQGRSLDCVIQLAARALRGSSVPPMSG